MNNMGDDPESFSEGSRGRPRPTRGTPIRPHHSGRPSAVPAEGYEVRALHRYGAADIPHLGQWELLPARGICGRLLDRDGVLGTHTQLGVEFRHALRAHRDQASRVQLHEQVTSHPGASDMLTPSNKGYGAGDGGDGAAGIQPPCHG
jgi:hypothetical protein